MGTAKAALVFHHAPKPVSVNEFSDALHAICRPRYPNARVMRAAHLALAVSGGVDSMALSYLFSEHRRLHQWARVGDYPVDQMYALMVDHQLREESHAETVRLAPVLRDLGFKPVVCRLHWKEYRKQGIDPSTLPNIESLARTQRYRVLGTNCKNAGIDRLFLAHHRDDQYETILMRLISGHGYRGLLGIREANPIPECYDLHNIYNSGLLNEFLKQKPTLRFVPAISDIKQLRRSWKLELRSSDHLTKQGLDYWSSLFQGRFQRDHDPNVPYVTPLPREEGGLVLYRPLLEFDKDRLIATCEANKIPWVEDRTNADPTMTMRNAVRYLVKNHQLPTALQKPSVLALCKNSRRRAQFEESAADRLIKKSAAIKVFDPNAGTLLVEPPPFKPPKAARRTIYTEAREAARRPQRRVIAAIMCRKFIDFVTPDSILPPLTNLDNLVNLLFPQLSPERGKSPPKSCSIAGVQFDPVVTSKSTKWFLFRAPYSSQKRLPKRTLGGRTDYLSLSEAEFKSQVYWQCRKSLKSWDGRFWIGLITSVNERFYVLPFKQSAMKPFRMALPKPERARLDRVLKYYAPGKVRWTLPAIYTREDSGGRGSPSEKTLLALPTLGFHVPGMERWIKYDFRYKKVDANLLAPIAKRPGAFLTYRHALGTSRRRRNTTDEKLDGFEERRNGLRVQSGEAERGRPDHKRNLQTKAILPEVYELQETTSPGHVQQNIIRGQP
ncbi:hypothetical protein S7711_02550 [Stachybotrys chartarum IBT 7711]|uniref:tRNA(Ile)-lysidine synthetase n=1 Tax=Stachybotrys chartarum (strain CBS 109288 / IBT 7711) TaxID=1280523 RepID=A0A084B5D7_STACB|nr:hypothetical protein S7711_02550 [Stachybotrys chartarum IBT 7711]